MKELTIIFFSSWKFAATFPVAIFGMNMTVAETLLFTNIGGIIGVIIFAKFSRRIISSWNKYMPERFKRSRKPKKTFTRKNRRIIKLKSRYGLPGIVILNPILLSIPVATFLVVKYYGKKTSNLMWLVAGQLTWSMIYTFFYFQVFSI